jgi:predicted PurR-regulated permease PerM
MMPYLGGAFLVFGILLNAFIHDETTPKTHWQSWMCIVIATIVWPLVLPAIIRKKLSKENLEKISFYDQDWRINRELRNL